MLTDDSLRALESILDALRAIEGPKHLVWLSEGLVIDGPGAIIRPIERAAAAARTTIHVLLVDPPLADVSVGARPPTPLYDRMQEEQGLRQLAAMTRGDLRRVGPNADAVFERLEREISGYYLLGVESLPSDEDGKGHEIDVSVLRRGTRVRARREFLLPAPDEEPNGGIDEQMQRALQAPFVVTGLPLRLATYRPRGAAACTRHHVQRARRRQCPAGRRLAGTDAGVRGRVRPQKGPTWGWSSTGCGS